MIHKISLLVALAVLMGVSILPGQPVLIDFTRSECDDCCDHDRLQPRIAYQHSENGISTVGLQIITNCGHRFPSFYLNEDSLKLVMDAIQVKVTEYINDGGEEVVEEHLIEDVVFCDCYFNLEYQIEGLQQVPSVITFNDSVIEYHEDQYKTYPVKFEMAEGDTINYVDKYGFKQGKWLKKDHYGGTTNGHITDGEWDYYIRTKRYETGSLKVRFEYKRGQPWLLTFWYPTGQLMMREKESWARVYYDLEGKKTLSRFIEDQGYDLQSYL